MNLLNLFEPRMSNKDFARYLTYDNFSDLWRRMTEGERFQFALLARISLRSRVDPHWWKREVGGKGAEHDCHNGPEDGCGCTDDLAADLAADYAADRSADRRADRRADHVADRSADRRADREGSHDEGRQ